MSIYRTWWGESGWDLIQKTSFPLQRTLGHVWSTVLNKKETSASIYKYRSFHFVSILSLGWQGWILSESLFCVFSVLCVRGFCTCPRRQELSLLTHLGVLGPPWDWSCKKQTPEERIPQSPFAWPAYSEGKTLVVLLQLHCFPSWLPREKRILDQWDFKGRSIVKSWTSWNRKNHTLASVSILWCVREFVLVPLTGSPWSNQCIIPCQLGCFSPLANMKHWRIVEPLLLMQMSCSMSSTVQLWVLNHLILAHVFVQSRE